MTFEAPFRHGILSQGELITSPEQHRLLAKRAWLQLADYLHMNDERLKLTQLVVPTILEDDPDIQAKQLEAIEDVQRFSDEESYWDFINSDSEKYYEDMDFDWVFDCYPDNPRMKWVVEKALSENPRTILELGPGWGNITTILARKGYNVTGLAPNKDWARRFMDAAKEKALPIDILTGIIETFDFEQRQFDVVLCCELLEHVHSDLFVLSKCVDLARHAVILTVPDGACEGGFWPDATWRKSREHVRIYTENSLRRLISRLGSRIRVEVFDRAFSCSGKRGQPINCLCMKLVKVKEVIGDGEDISPQKQEVVDAAS